MAGPGRVGIPAKLTNRLLFSAEKPNKLEEIERSIRDAEEESLFFLDEDEDQVLLSLQGGKGDVEFSLETLDPLPKDRALVMTHNHPRWGGNFSGNDLASAIMMRCPKLRIRAVDGQYRYEMELWPPNSQVLLTREAKMLRKLKATLSKEVGKPRERFNQALIVLMHLAGLKRCIPQSLATRHWENIHHSMQKLADEMDWNYRREKWPDR